MMSLVDYNSQHVQHRSGTCMLLYQQTIPDRRCASSGYANLEFTGCDRYVTWGDINPISSFEQIRKVFFLISKLNYYCFMDSLLHFSNYICVFFPLTVT